MSISRKSQCDKLLTVFRRNPKGLTDIEAATKARLVDLPGACWWHRASDLRKAGLIEWKLLPNGQKVMKMGEFGRPCGVSQVTDKGLVV